MAWLKVDDKFPSHPKVRRAAVILASGDAGPAAKLARARVLAVWLEAACYAAEHSTDGFVPADVVGELVDRKPIDVVAAMVQAGLAKDETHQDIKGVRFHDWDHYNPTAADVKAKRDADRERKRHGKGGGK